MYEFSWMWFFIGIVFVAVGIVIVRFYKQAADNLSYGPSSYRNFQIAALILCGLGILFIFNLHNLILGFLFNLIFGGAIKK
ncbi:hypothetical protein FWF74_00755 [Candidatus Saccharibacteria bacterium]|nr:hypothetical protein [Candidatus Saccharibacteria bacterium]